MSIERRFSFDAWIRIALGRLYKGACEVTSRIGRASAGANHRRPAQLTIATGVGILWANPTQPTDCSDGSLILGFVIGRNVARVRMSENKVVTSSVERELTLRSKVRDDLGAQV